MKASLFILCTILTVLQAEKYYRRKNSNYQTGQLDKDNHETVISSDVNLEPEHIEDDEETNLKPKKTVVYCPGHKNTHQKTRSLTKKKTRANINRRKNMPRTTKKVRGAKRLNGVNRIDRNEEVEEDKEITLAKKVREFEKEMRDAKLAKGGDGGYNTVTYYDGNVSKGGDENGSGKLDAADVGRRTTTPTTDNKVGGIRRITGVKSLDRKEEVEEDKEITLAKKVREFEREMRDAKLAKGGDGGYTTVTYYDGNVSKGGDENGSGKLDAADVGRRTTTPTTDNKVGGIRRITGVKRIDRKKDVEEDKELTLAKKVREFEREMRDAKFAKGGDGGYNTVTYYDGNVSKGY